MPEPIVEFDVEFTLISYFTEKLTVEKIPFMFVISCNALGDDRTWHKTLLEWSSFELLNRSFASVKLQGNVWGLVCNSFRNSYKRIEYMKSR